MEWIITKDLIAEPGEKKRVGYGVLMSATVLTLPPKGDPTRRAAKEAYVATLPYEFRLFDDDNVLYYEGRCGDITSACEEEAFGPQDWAMNEAGVTTTEYRKVGATKWEDL
jgi:hypothetical protein